MNRDKWTRFSIRMLILVALPTLAAAIVNAARPQPLDWVAERPYEIFQDCPETTQTAETISMEALARALNDYLLVDCRSAEDFAATGVEGSVSIPYNPLFSISPEALAKLDAKRKGRPVVVVGTGVFPKLFAAELVEVGAKSVLHLETSEKDWTELRKNLSRN